jgi:hypothetical protein
MGWKNWPAWLKGGLIATIAYIILAIAMYLLPCSNDSLFTGGRSCLGVAVLFLVVSSPGLGILSLLGIDYSQNTTLVIITTILAYFIVGAFIGMVISKLRSRKK